MLCMCLSLGLGLFSLLSQNGGDSHAIIPVQWNKTREDLQISHHNFSSNRQSVNINYPQILLWYSERFMVIRVFILWITSFLILQFSCSVMSDSLQPHGLQHGLPVHHQLWSLLKPSGQWCHPTVSSSLVPFSSCLQSCPASGSFPMSQFFASGG